MKRSTSRMISLCLMVLAFLVGSAAAEAQNPPLRVSEIPEPITHPVSGDKVVVIPQNWKSLYPFSARFPAADKDLGAHIIELEAANFTTVGLTAVKRTGQRSFERPDLSSFASELVREPFVHAETDLFLVQAGSPEQQVELRQQLEAMGLEIRGYYPRHAYLVRLDASQKQELAQLKSVFWMGYFQPAWKIAPKLEYIIESDPQRELELTVSFDRAILKTEAALREELNGLGVSILEVDQNDESFRVTLRGAAVTARRLAASAGCLRVEREPSGGLLVNTARTSANTTTGRGAQAGPIMDVEDVWARGIRGEGQIAAVADTGLSTGNLSTLHRDFGQVGSSTNPPRVIQTYALARPSPANWDDDNTLPGGGHGTHVTGLLLGNGVRSGSQPQNNLFPPGSYTGIAPKANLVFQSIMNDDGAIDGLPNDLGTLYLPPYQDGARVHSNSWRYFANGSYDFRASDTDEFAWDYKDMVLVFGVGNEGADVFGGPDGVIESDSIGSPAVAKNVIAVGATENYRPGFVLEDPAGDCTSSDGVEQKTWGWYGTRYFPPPFQNPYTVAPIFSDLFADHASGMAPFSSRGPTNDDRIKPDLVAPGGFITSTRTNRNQTFEHAGTCGITASLKTHYLNKEGTSMATPLVAGAAVLTRQYYKEGWHPNGSLTTHSSAVAGDGFNPSAALVKATLIHGAFDLTPGQYGVGSTQEVPPGWDGTNNLPNNASGYGRVDLEGALFPGSGFGHSPGRKMAVHDVTPGLATGQQDEYTFQVSSTSDPLTVTLVWTDPEASPGSGRRLVNDLNLTVIAPNGTVYLPNGIDRTTGSADSRNNVEQARVTSPQTGTWTVRVNGASIPGNGDAGTTTQPYALVASAVLSTGTNLPPVCQNDSFTTPQDTQLSIFLGNLLGNDSDPDSDPLWLWSYDLTTAQGGTNDTGHIGGFNYTPATGFTGTDSFSYTIADRGDGTGLTDTCTVFVQVTPTTFADTFTGNGPVNGRQTEVGGAVWSARAGARTSAGTVVDNAAIGGVPLKLKAERTAATVAISADVDPTSSDWVGVGFANAATAPYWNSGELWVLLRPNGNYAVRTQSGLLSSGAIPGTPTNGYHQVEVQYAISTNLATVLINGTAVVSSQSLPATPNVQYAGFHMNRSAEGGGKVDNFEVTLGSNVLASDSFTGGGPLHGRSVDVGGVTWSAEPAAVLGGGRVIDSASIGGIPFDPSTLPGTPTVALTADVNPTSSDWVGVGFADAAASPYWSSGELWVLLQPNGNYIAYALGSQLATGTIPGTATNGFHQVEVRYATGSNQATILLNGTAVVSAQTLTSAPNISHAGFHMARAGGAKIDNFEVGPMP